MEIIINPKDYEKEYIAYLNQCFEDWGNKDNYNWCFLQNFGLQNADILIIKEEDAVIAGSALTYRTIAIPNGEFFLHGTMTGSWTLSGARGKGCFSVIIQESKKIVTAHNYDFLTAYVTESNASFRRLEAAGAYLLPTNYIVGSIPEQFNEQVVVNIIEDDSIYEFIYNQRKEQLKYNLHYHYTLEQFIIQYIMRPEGKSKIISLDGELCILSETATTYRILYSTSYQYNFLEKLRIWAANCNKNIFFFTTKLIEKIINNEAYKIIPGYLTILSTKKHQETIPLQLRNNHFHIEYGDKM